MNNCVMPKCVNPYRCASLQGPSSLWFLKAYQALGKVTPTWPWYLPPRSL